jgi:hypothetical protein
MLRGVRSVFVVGVEKLTHQFSPLVAADGALMALALSKLVSICRLPDTYALCQFKSV